MTTVSKTVLYVESATGTAAITVAKTVMYVELSPDPIVPVPPRTRARVKIRIGERPS